MTVICPCMHAKWSEVDPDGPFTTTGGVTVPRCLSVAYRRGILWHGVKFGLSTRVAQDSLWSVDVGTILYQQPYHEIAATVRSGMQWQHSVKG